MSGPVKVSVLMTLYNKAPFVEEAVASILGQRYTDLELLLVDDASTDDGVERVRRLNDPRIRIITSPVNTGRAAAANRGYAAARGEYLVILDADDIAHPERIFKQVDFMESHPQVGVCGTYARRFGKVDRISTWPLTDVRCRGLMFFTDPVLYGSTIMRRSVLVGAGIRSDEQWKLPGEDFLLAHQIGKHTRFANLPEVLLHYRIGEQNQRHGRDVYADKRAICSRLFQLYDISLSDEELDLHLLFYLLTRQRITGARVRAFHKWTQHLMELNKERGLFPPAEFEEEVTRRWNRLYYLLPEHGTAATWAHLRCTGNWTLGKLVYYAKVRAKALLGP